MEEYLDSQNIVRRKGTRLSVVSFCLSATSLTFLIILILLTAKRLEPGQGIVEPPSALIAGLLISTLAGLLFGTISFVRRERNTIFKWMGGIINVLLFLFLVATIVWANLLI